VLQGLEMQWAFGATSCNITIASLLHIANYIVTIDIDADSVFEGPIFENGFGLNLIGDLSWRLVQPSILAHFQLTTYQLTTKSHHVYMDVSFYKVPTKAGKKPLPPSPSLHVHITVNI